MIKNQINSEMRWHHTAWTPPSLPDSVVLLGASAGGRSVDIVPGFSKQSSNFSPYDLCPGGGGFEFDELMHSGDRACGIPDGETIVMSGGFPLHSYVTRCICEFNGAL